MLAPSGESRHGADESARERFGAMDKTKGEDEQTQPAPDRPRWGWGEDGEGVSSDPSSAPDLWNDPGQLLSSHSVSAKLG